MALEVHDRLGPDREREEVDRLGHRGQGVVGDGPEPQHCLDERECHASDGPEDDQAVDGVLLHQTVPSSAAARPTISPIFCESLELYASHRRGCVRSGWMQQTR